MHEITQILKAVEEGDTEAAEKLVPLTYDELRRMANARMADERKGHTLQPTALIHEAYLRLSDPEGKARHWNSRAHFFSAAAEAMRRILIEHARKKKSIKRGQDPVHTNFDDKGLAVQAPSEEILAVHEALEKLENEDPELAKLAKLRYFAGMTVPETAVALGVSQSTVNRSWRYARAWLHRAITEGDGSPSMSP